ncbi:MAG TPA: alpha/beta hydrolase, partial [Patescibacteria group bacterium]|nr:alpha/beta hydrolase [Patescibacteria group bacterium]
MSKSALAACVILASALTTPAWAKSGDCVIILHGIGRTSSSMEELKEEFETHGYSVLNIDYPSREKTIVELADDI